MEKTGLGTGAQGLQLVSRGPLAPAPVSSPVRTERHRIAREDRSPTLRYSSQTRAQNFGSRFTCQGFSSAGSAGQLLLL